MTIKHIVLPSGGPKGLYVYGVLKYLNDKKRWNYSDIETIHGSSIGSFMALVVLLNIDWQELDNYFINRPWEKVFDINAERIIEFYDNKGVFNIEKLKITLEPLFKTKDIPLDITFKDLFNKTGKDLFVYVSEINNFKLCTFSNNTHPDMPVVEAVYMSCAIPPIFSPIIKNDKCYIDGGLINKYPLDMCLNCEYHKVNVDDVLGIKFVYSDNHLKTTQENTLLEFISNIITAMINKCGKSDNCQNIKNEIIIKPMNCTVDFWLKILSDRKIRENIITEGATFAKIFINYSENTASKN